MRLWCWFVWVFIFGALLASLLSQSLNAVSLAEFAFNVLYLAMVSTGILAVIIAVVDKDDWRKDAGSALILVCGIGVVLSNLNSVILAYFRIRAPADFSAVALVLLLLSMCAVHRNSKCALGFYLCLAVAVPMSAWFYQFQSPYFYYALDTLLTVAVGFFLLASGSTQSRAPFIVAPLLHLVMVVWEFVSFIIWVS